MKTKLIGAALALLMTSGVAQAGSCQDATAKYKEDVAKDAADYAANSSAYMPGAKENVDRLNAKIKANIIEGCKPGGFYDQSDKALEEIKAECKAHPDRHPKTACAGS